MIGIPDVTGGLQAQRSRLDRALDALEEGAALLARDSPADWRGPARDAFDGARHTVRGHAVEARARVSDARANTDAAITTLAGRAG
ncbi:hypothetical protein CLV46_3281 [Diaminobutyricimonas aerilata]|uniref:Uncharacterized protein n=1 Tax=Diaminobutyricimonas aerilata TaxID=1162967 RepID=A0A2M9CP60_9MICO|nr:hypothetical protein [Diaminobutyricimonas aerilata]PJJ73685.1 hypothetical protein CLV46_3281 [Diaminobutyricimonas aerilata]